MSNLAKTDVKNGAIGSYNEWDPLEEVVVGHVAGASWPDWDSVESIPVSDSTRRQVVRHRGHWRAYPESMRDSAEKCLTEFISILEAEGVRVRRPDDYPFLAPYGTPHWQVQNGFCAANPRDVILVVGTTFLECPMAHRGRHYEIFPYRSLMMEYWQRGANWISAPRPQLKDDLYDPTYVYPEAAPENVEDDWRTISADNITFLTTEVEPVFDAADFVRCGRDIYGQRSQVTNRAGIEWLRRLLGSDFRIHLLPTRCPSAYHIDTTFMPLAPGKVLANPNFLEIDRLPDSLRNWDILIPPPPVPTPIELAGWMSDWISMNVLMLDERRVIVEREQEPLIRAFRDWGFQPIPCSFKDCYPYLGSLHCATLDTVRRGTLEDYS